MTIRHPLYQAALDADKAFHAELVATYGNDASNARYDYVKSTATPRLDDLAAAKIAADIAWLDEMRKMRTA